jgi:hypothetical protein
MGPVAAKSYPGQELVKIVPEPDDKGRPRTSQRARQEIDYGRREKGYIYGALQPLNGRALTEPYEHRNAALWADFLEKAEAWVPGHYQKVYAIVDNLSAHRASDVLLFSLHHPRWEFIFQPKYAAYLNLLEPWWKVLRSLALKGRRFENWDEICAAIAAATNYWNRHRHPFKWGQRRRHQQRRKPGIAAVPGVRGLAG